MDDYSIELKIDYKIRKFILDNGILISNPPSGKQKITNIYYNPSTGSIEVEVQT